MCVRQSCLRGKKRVEVSACAHVRERERERGRPDFNDSSLGLRSLKRKNGGRNEWGSSSGLKLQRGVVAAAASAARAK